MIHNISGKQQEYKTVFLDLDGTIVASSQGAINGIIYMFEKTGREIPDEQTLLRFMGPSVMTHLQEEHSFSKEDAKHAYQFFREYYLSKGILENQLYEGITDTINALRSADKDVYVATNKPEEQALSILKRYGITDLFVNIFGARHDLGIYNKKLVLARALDTIGSMPDSPVMVGDRHHDIIAGQHVGFDTVGVLYGYGTREELLKANCDYILDNVADISLLLGRKQK